MVYKGKPFQLVVQHTETAFFCLFITGNGWKFLMHPNSGKRTARERVFVVIRNLKEVGGLILGREMHASDTDLRRLPSCKGGLAASGNFVCTRDVEARKLSVGRPVRIGSFVRPTTNYAR